MYLGIAGLIWLGEGILFGHFLRMSPWQIVLLVILYVALYVVVLRYFLLSLRDEHGAPDMAKWRAVSVAPMVVTIIGSFVSLPLILLVAVLGRVI